MHLRDAMQFETKRREWRIERVGWALIAAIVLLGALGAFGGGPLSRTLLEVAEGDATYAADYERFNRRDHVSLLIVHVDAASAMGDELRIGFDTRSSSEWTIRSSHPSGTGEVDETGLVYSYPVGDWSNPIAIGFEYIPEGVGRTSVTLVISAGGLAPATIELPQFIYP